MKILVAGANGQVGRNIIRLGPDFDLQITGLDQYQLDISSPMSIEKAFLNFEPDLIINAAAYTNVDGAEKEIDAATAANEKGPELLAKACLKFKIPLFHISTDYVFNGSLDRPYTEDDPVQPIGVYGVSKEAGEKHIRRILPQHIILRTSWVFSKEGPCFPKTILNIAKNRQEIRVVNDQVGSPTSAKSIAKTLLQIATKLRDCTDETFAWGTYHFSQQPYVTWYQFAGRAISLASELGLLTNKCTVSPCSSQEYPSPVARPKNSRLNTEKLIDIFKFAPTQWEQDLSEIILSMKTDAKV